MASSLLAHVAALGWTLGDLAFRRAQPAEAPLIFSRLLREKMNPIGVKPERFVLAWDKPKGAVAGFGQIRPVGDGSCELASLIVEPAYRGLGVGTVLVTKLLAQHRISGDAGKPVYLITLEQTSPFYERLGFGTANDPPSALKLEMAAGALVAKLATGQGLVCMQADESAVAGAEEGVQNQMR